MEKDKSPASRERILTSAVTLFAKQGYASTGVRELAEAAGVNLAMINYFFGSKKELLKTILDTFFSGYLEVLQRELTSEGSPEQRIARLIDKALGYISENREYMIVTLTELPHDDPEIIVHKASWARQAMEVIEREICIPMEQQNGKKISPVVLGPVLISMMCSRFLFAPVMEEVAPPGYGEEFIQEYPAMITELFLSGITGLTSDDKEVLQ